MESHITIYLNESDMARLFDDGSITLTLPQDASVVSPTPGAVAVCSIQRTETSDKIVCVLIRERFVCPLSQGLSKINFIDKSLGLGHAPKPAKSPKIHPWWKLLWTGLLQLANPSITLSSSVWRELLLAFTRSQ